MSVAGRPAKMDRGQLTQVDYWDEHWSRARRSQDCEGLAWVSRSYPFIALDQLLRSVLPADASKTFLELGSGPARWMIYFHKTFGYRVTGCDTSPRSWELAHANLTAAGVPGTILQTDFFALEGTTYDIVFSGGVVEHFEDPSAPLAVFARLVAPGGLLVTDVPNLTGLNGWYRRLLQPETFATHRPIHLAELRRWHRNLGLQEVVATPYGSVSLARLPAAPFPSWPRVQRLLWHPAHRVAYGSLERLCRALHGIGARLDHPRISPHLLVVARKPEGASRGR
jgi:2-polyprenyl-6-hydroxyphenyl methylase/3-demethylubiquinone-9 3-methyltransferase